MKKAIAVVAVLLSTMVLSNVAQAGWPQARLFGGMAARGAYWNDVMAQTRPWHGDYYYLPAGQPVALVVPPNAVMQQNYSWGVSQNTMTPIVHQYVPQFAPPLSGMFYATPPWPSHTRQFGVYPVRAPW